MNAPGGPSTAEHLEQLRADARRIAEVVATGPLDAPVAACPGWTIGDLVGHLGGVHRWALNAVREGRRPEARPSTAGPEGADLGEWLVDGADAIADAIAAVPADTPSWNPWGTDPTVGFWARRQALETMIHRWDAEAAVGGTTPLPASMASDAIDELFEVILPRTLRRDDAVPPTGSLHVHCTDVPGEWLVWIGEGDGDSDGHGELMMRREHAKGDAAMRGPAETLVLHLWGRTHELTEPADVVGDAAVAATWARLTG